MISRILSVQHRNQARLTIRYTFWYIEHIIDTIIFFKKNLPVAHKFLPTKFSVIDSKFQISDDFSIILAQIILTSMAVQNEIYSGRPATANNN